VEPVQCAQGSTFTRHDQVEQRWNGCRKIKAVGCDPDEQTQKNGAVVGVRMVNHRLIRGPRRNGVTFEMRVNLVRAMMVGGVAVRMGMHQRR